MAGLSPLPYRNYLIGIKTAQRWLLTKNRKTVGLFPKRFSSRAIYTAEEINPNEDKFDKILIANRGEIACRIIKTCRAMGIKTVAVHSDVDSNAVHVRMADEAFCIGTAQALHSYLKMENIVEACLKTGAQAVHPGYGFLSENVSFSNKLSEHSIIFIGPPPKALEGMGDKLMSKKLAKEAGVNTVPGFDGIVKDAEECVKIARDIGYPVMIKASAGGGGKGMRIAWNDEEAREGFRFSTQEAISSFNDDRILVEKFIDNPRHIEMQILADSYGNAIHLNERECSIQRRNQKVIEEAPSPFLDPKTRSAMGAQAVALAKKIGYTTAGTVEFLVDSKKNFYFLEMNTRLQVEHPITECITGVDLVQQMIRIAKGHKLNITQENIMIRGWAIESRVYAEDPLKNFGLPSVGRLNRYIEPTHIPKVRCDSGIEEGSEISIYYDPMICKLVTYGDNRNDTINTHLDALDSYVIRGVTHNISLLRDILSEENFVKGNISTKYLTQIYPDGFKGKQLSSKELDELVTIAGCIYFKNEFRSWNLLNQKRLKVIGIPPKTINVSVEILGQTFNIEITQDNNNYKVHVKNRNRTLTMGGKFTLAEPVFTCQIDGVDHILQLISVTHSGGLRIRYKGTAFKVQVLSTKASELMKLMPEKPKVDQSKIVVSPMPGLVKSVACEVGQMVAEGQEVCVIEAMKMQNRLTASITGKVKAVNVKPGETVEEEAVLVELE